MGSGEMGGGEAPGIAGSFHAIGPGGIPLKKKVMPKAAPKKLVAKKNWKESFIKYSTKLAGGKRGK